MNEKEDQRQHCDDDDCCFFNNNVDGLLLGKGLVTELDVLHFVGSYEAYTLVTRIVGPSRSNRNYGVLDEARKRFLYDFFDLCQMNLTQMRIWLSSNSNTTDCIASSSNSRRAAGSLLSRISTRTLLEWESQFAQILAASSGSSVAALGLRETPHSAIVEYLAELCHRDHGLSCCSSEPSYRLESLVTDLKSLEHDLKQPRCLISDVDLLKHFLYSLDDAMDYVSKRRRLLCYKQLKTFMEEAVVIISPQPVTGAKRRCYDGSISSSSSSSSINVGPRQRVIDDIQRRNLSPSGCMNRWAQLLLDMIWKLLSIGVVDPNDFLEDYCIRVLHAFRDYFHIEEQQQQRRGGGSSSSSSSSITATTTLATGGLEVMEDNLCCPSDNEKYLFGLLWNNTSFQTIMKKSGIVQNNKTCFAEIKRKGTAAAAATGLQHRRWSSRTRIPLF